MLTSVKIFNKRSWSDKEFEISANDSIRDIKKLFEQHLNIPMKNQMIFIGGCAIKNENVTVGGYQDSLKEDCRITLYAC